MLLSDMTSASRSMGVLAGGANWGCYGPSLVPVLPQLPGGAQHPPAPPTLRPCLCSAGQPSRWELAHIHAERPVSFVGAAKQKIANMTKFWTFWVFQTHHVTDQRQIWRSSVNPRCTVHTKPRHHRFIAPSLVAENTKFDGIFTFNILWWRHLATQR